VRDDAGAHRLTGASSFLLRLLKWPPLLPALRCGMAPFIYRCPATGMKVQGWSADDPSEDEGEAYETERAFYAVSRRQFATP
jgi:hypothetical protein